MKQKTQGRYQKQTDYCSNRNYQPTVGLYAGFWRIGSLINIHRMHSFFFNFYGAQQGKFLLQIAQTANEGVVRYTFSEDFYLFVKSPESSVVKRGGGCCNVN